MVVNTNKKCINFHKLVHRIINKYNYEKVKNVRNVNLNTYNKLITK